MRQRFIHIRRSARVEMRARQHGEKGYLLLSVMLLITLMLIVMTAELPRIAQQVKREKEEELVNRGMDYARAVKRFYHKSNQYPNSIEQLKDTNHIRFLRKEYKDPMTGESEWKLVHVNEAEIKIPQGNGVPGLQGANPGLVGGTGNNPTAQAGGTAGNTGNTGTTGASSFSGSSGLSSGSSGLSSGSSGLSSGGTGLQGSSTGNTGLSGSTTNTSGGSPQNAPQQGLQGGSGALQTSGIGLATPTQVGGGQIIGFASTSKKNSIKEFNEKNEYDQWYFVYDPRLEQQGPNQIGSANGGLAVAAPRGANGGQGAPVGLQGSTAPQPNGQQQPNGQFNGQPQQNGQPQTNGQPSQPGSGAPNPTPTPQVPQ